MFILNSDMNRFRKMFFHEICMCLMLGQILLRLIFFSQAYAWIGAYIVVIATSCWLIIQGKITLCPRTNRFRLLWNMVAVNFAFTSIKYVVPALGLTPMDSQLTSIDIQLIGCDLSIIAQQWYSKPLTEIMSLGYMLFIVFLFFSFFYYAIKADLPKLLAFCSSLFVIYAFGITGYTLVPAQGPYVYHANVLTVPVEGYIFTWLNSVMVAAGSAGYDVFPSLHVAVGMYILLFYARYDRTLWSIYLIPFILLTLSTIYLRYHYFIDIICGATLCLISFYGCLGFSSRRLPQQLSTPRSNNGGLYEHH